MIVIVLVILFETQHNHQAAFRVKSRVQAAAAALSSFLYLIPAIAYAHGPEHIWNDVGVILFVCVAIASACADGSVAEATWLGRTNRALLRLTRLADRWLATSAGVFAVLPNLWPFHHWQQTMAVLVCMAIAIAPLHAARRTHHSHVWTWVTWQSVWHLASALAVAYFGPQWDWVQ